MNKNHLMSRLMSFGLTTILLTLTVSSIWATLTTQQAATRTAVSEYLNDQYQQARFAVGAEESLERKYRIEPGPEPLAAHTAAAADLITALQHVARAGDASDRRVVEQVLAIHQRYLLATHQMFAAVDQGNTAQAMKLDHTRIDPVFTAMQQQVNIQATGYHAEAIQSLAAHLSCFPLVSSSY